MAEPEHDEAGPSEAGPEPTGAEPPRADPPSRYPAIVGIVFLIVIAVAAVSTFGGDGDRILGASDEQAGTPLAEFALPDIRGELDGDANVDQTDCEIEAIPCPPERARPTACEIEVDGAIRVCDLFDRPLVMSWWFTRGGDCLPTQDVVDEASRRWGDDVAFLSVNVRDDRETVERVVAERGWQIEVGWDRDGEASNLYRVGVCPTVVLARPGGILERAVVGAEELEPDALDSHIEDLVEASRRAQREAG